MSKPAKLSDVLSRDELRELRQRSDLKAVLAVLWTWTLIALAFGMAIVWTNPLTILLGIVILGGRQLGLGILLHDCAHHALFERKEVNEFVGHWICGSAVNASLHEYRPYHLSHHKLAGTPEDPDIVFVKNYPVTKNSLRRKFIRDFTGQTAFRDAIQGAKRFKLSKNYPWLIFHFALFSVLLVVGAPWAYLMWLAAAFFTYPAIVRLRQIGEHGAVKERMSSDVRLNTGTTAAPFWQRIFISPNNVNYHIEHHLFASIPPYNLRRLHKILVLRGYYDGMDCIAKGYGDVLRRAIRPEPVAG